VRRLSRLALGDAWIVQALATVRASGLPDAWIGGGLIRDLVWGKLFGTGFEPAHVRDVDVAYFDPSDLSRDADARATDLLNRLRPGVPWEAKNQAAVHLWYHERFGGDPVPALESIPDAVATWPETATCVALRRTAGDPLSVCAPFGLDDLFDGIWRRNPARIGPELARARLDRIQPLRRWPGVRVIEGLVG
jgi:uncharacterized protein